jgi:dTDP-4-amino-4,6-dideoxygalactose transaminase
MSVTALKGGTPIRTKPVNTWPMHDEAEEKALLGVLRSGKWWYGERVKEFEEKYAAFQGAKHGISCTNGTSALWIALKALGIGSGDEVITTPWTFIATSTAVVLADAIPVFVDIELDTLNMNLDQVEAAITPRTKAILPVHFFGRPLDMDRLMAIAKKHNLAVVEDAAHAWGGRYKERGLGCIGEVGTFSFQFSKNMTAAEGGIVLTNDDDLAVNCWSFMNCGRWPGKPWYHMENIAGNNRLTEFQAALLTVQLGRMESQMAKRTKMHDFLWDKFRELPCIGVMAPDDAYSTRRSHHGMALRFVREKWDGVTRETFLKAMEAEGITVMTGYAFPIYREPAFTKRRNFPMGDYPDYAAMNLPVVEQAVEEVFLIPQHLLLADENDVLDIVRAVEKLWENRKELV